jgi:hypothetical protein
MAFLPYSFSRASSTVGEPVASAFGVLGAAAAGGGKLVPRRWDMREAANIAIRASVLRGRPQSGTVAVRCVVFTPRRVLGGILDPRTARARIFAAAASGRPR